MSWSVEPAVVSNRVVVATFIMSIAIALSGGVVPVSADPPNSTDHGISDATFHKLWAGDQDRPTESPGPQEETSVAQLANRTDIPLDAPPQAVEQWNRGDHQEFPATNHTVSIHPPDAERTGGRFIRDAYTAVFSVQPSTRARLSPAKQPLYVAPNGTVRGTVDYRVVVPPDEIADDRRVYWRLASHQVDTTRLLVDEREETTTAGSHTPALSYSMDGVGGDRHQLTLQADISVRLIKEVEVCTEHDDDGDCTEWTQHISYPTETVTVADSINVTTYNLTVSGSIAQYPNGDLGLVVYKNQPWLGYQLPNGDVRGVWRFYSARDNDWDTLVYRSDNEQRTTHSPLHPLQVNAYPIETGPTPSPRQNVTILDVYGTSTAPPTLPSDVKLDVLTEPYTASYGIATRASTDQQPATIRAWGLVRGVEATRPAEEFIQIPIHESNLTLTVLNQTTDTVTVRVTLHDATTGTSIHTARRGGAVIINGERVNTNANGTVTTTIERTPGGVTARYEPGDWWHTPPGYTGDSTTVMLKGPALRIASALFRISMLVALFLLATFLVDRSTGLEIWPPWRSL